MNWIITSILILYASLSLSQSPQRCNADKNHSFKISDNPALEKRYLDSQSKIMDQYNHQSTKDLIDGIVVIPTVFHIIHNGDAIGTQENLSETLILEQLAQLNADFSRTNVDASDTPVAFQDRAADTQIQFCLAASDPQGNETNGIVRTHINSLPNVSESDCWTPDYIDSNILPDIIWDNSFFLNIVTVVGIDEFANSNCNFFSTLGYAQFPGGNDNTDAVVLAFYTVGSLDNPNPLLNNYLGRTATHEVGHWLGLQHLWGFGNGGCAQDDGINDTPSQFESTNGCPLFPFFDSCTPADNGILFMNYMDYSDDHCMNLFTEQQASLMRATINSVRGSLRTSPCNEESILDIDPLVLFELKNNNYDVIISWEFQSDYENVGIYKGKIIDNLEHITTVEFCSDGGLMSVCDYLDSEIEDGLNYYQLLFYKNGSVIYTSKIKTVLIENDNDPQLARSPSYETLAFKNLKRDVVYNVEIINVKGEKTMQQNITQGEHIRITDLESGMYFVKLSTNSQSLILKWLKH